MNMALYDNTPTILSPQMAKQLTCVTLGLHAEAEFMDSLFPNALFLRLPSLSPKITVIDFAHHAFGETCPCPVYVDDEGVKAQDVYIVNKGRIGQVMTNKKMAKKLDIPLTGNARIPAHGEPPQTYMRNTALLPWDDNPADMLASIKEGFYLVSGSPAGGDGTGEYACNITEGYFVKNGKIGKPLKGFAAYGDGLAFLKSISMVGNDFKWFVETFPECPLAPQAFGAPSLKANVSLLTY